MMKDMVIQQQHVTEENMSNLTSASGEASGNSSGNRNGGNVGNGENGSFYPQHQPYNLPPPAQAQAQNQSLPLKRKRNLPGNPDPDAEVIALSPKTLLTTNRFICEICNKGFQRDQNLQLHRRGHNLPWKLKQRTSKEIKKKVYVCPETSCVHHDPTRALGDLTGIKKHFFRKHGEKKWKCEKCSKRYAVQSDWKAHSKTCGTKEYRCDCGTLFSRRDSFITHRAFCDALAEESARAITGNSNGINSSSISQFENHDLNNIQIPSFNLKKEPQSFGLRPEFPQWLAFPQHGGGITQGTILMSSSSMFNNTRFDLGHPDYRDNNHQEIENPNLENGHGIPPYHLPMVASSPHTSATALLQKAAQMGATISSENGSGSGSGTGTGTGTGSAIAATAGAPTMLLQQGSHQQGHVSSDTSSFSLNLSSREEFEASGFVVNNLASYGNKAAEAAEVAAHGTTCTTTLQEMMTSLSSSSSRFEGSFFEDAFGGFLNPKKDDTHLHGGGGGGGGSHHIGGGNDGMTRDFLGLRPLSHSEIFNITGLDNCMNKSSDDYQKQWQG